MFEGKTLTSLIERGRETSQRGKWDDALALYESAFARLPGEGDAAAAAELIRSIGILHAQRGEIEVAQEAFELALTIAEINGLRDEIAAASACIAANELHSGRLAQAEEWYHRARALVAESPDKTLGASIDQNLGIIANIRGDIPRAVHLYRSALKRYRRMGDDSRALLALNNLGMAYIDQAKWRSAARCYDQAEEIATRLKITPMLGSIEVNRAELFLRSGRLDRARTACDRALDIYGRLGFEPGLAEVDKFYGVLYRELRMLHLADRHFTSAVEGARRSGDLLLEAETLSEWALVHLDQERNPEALQALNGAHRLFSELHASRELHDLDHRLDGLELNYLQVVRAWGNSIDSQDPYTAGHCERVANYACTLAEAIGIEGRDLTWMRMGGYLHDVGKVAVPLEVLNKPGKLSPHEWELMKAHTTEGDAIVADLNFPWDIRPIVRSHHERWDGSGYPDGLKGEEIPLTARILCYADVYDALTTTRSYRPALPHSRAMHIIQEEVGRIFDPSLYPVFQSVIANVAPGADVRFPVYGEALAVA